MNARSQQNNINQNTTQKSGRTILATTLSQPVSQTDSNIQAITNNVTVPTSNHTFNTQHFNE